MAKRTPIPALLWFCLKFLVLVGFCLAAWTALIPYYGYLLVQICGGILRFVLGVPIEAGYIEAGGLMNTETLLVFALEGRELRTPFAKLVWNVAPYVALILATAGLGIARRLKILVYGLAILMAGHVAFIVLALRFRESIQQYSEIPTAIVQFYLTLPFLLWIVFAYWDRIAAYFFDADSSAEESETGQPDNTNDE